MEKNRGEETAKRKQAARYNLARVEILFVVFRICYHLLLKHEPLIKIRDIYFPRDLRVST